MTIWDPLPFLSLFGYWSILARDAFVFPHSMLLIGTSLDIGVRISSCWAH